MPAAVRVSDDELQEHRLKQGFPLGAVRQAGKAVYLYNHVDITVRIHENASGFNIVGFVIQPRSINSKRYDAAKQPGDPAQTCTIRPSRHAEDYASITSDPRTFGLTAST